jgi:hypothetical protein
LIINVVRDGELLLNLAPGRGRICLGDAKHRPVQSG